MDLNEALREFVTLRTLRPKLSIEEAMSPAKSFGITATLLRDYLNANGLFEGSHTSAEAVARDLGYYIKIYETYKEES